MNGNFALKVALPGHDAYTEDDSQPNAFSFSSNWNDLVKPNAIGIVGVSSDTTPYTVVFPALPYIPFCEIHGLVGTTFWDDREPRNFNKVWTIASNYFQVIRHPSVRWAYVVFKHQ